MRWNWQRPQWPNFTWEQDALLRTERIFLEEAGTAEGAALHLTTRDKETLSVELMTGNALSTAKIEGELLDRDSVQSSIQRGLGLKADKTKASPAEAGIASITVQNARTYAQPISHHSLHDWHRMVMAGRTDIDAVGRYREHEEAMQIASGIGRKRRVHFEAPPSKEVPGKMKKFIHWFNATLPARAEKPLPVLARAGVAHLWFESIHPFEDGNGRIGRAIAEKAIMQGLSSPTVTALSIVLLKRRKEYYSALSKASTGLDVTDWLLWFSGAAIEAGRHCLAHLEFLISKTKLMDSLRGRVNARQEKAILRLFAAGPEGFAGGMSAGKYVSLTGAAPATATRDLTDLAEKGALVRKGELKATRYYLNLDIRGRMP